MNVCLQGAPWTSMGMQVALSAWGMEPGQARSITATEDMDAPKSFAIQGKICGDEVAFWKSHIPQCSGTPPGVVWGHCKAWRIELGLATCKVGAFTPALFLRPAAGDFKCGGKGKNGPKGNWVESRTAD